jgi:hypothetical protein
VQLYPLGRVFFEEAREKMNDFSSLSIFIAAGETCASHATPSR